MLRWQSGAWCRQLQTPSPARSRAQTRQLQLHRNHLRHWRLLLPLAHDYRPPTTDDYICHLPATTTTATATTASQARALHTRPAFPPTTTTTTTASASCRHLLCPPTSLLPLLLYCRQLAALWFCARVLLPVVAVMLQIHKSSTSLLPTSHCGRWCVQATICTDRFLLARDLQFSK